MNIEQIRKMYRKGMRVKLISMKGESQMKAGIKGTVQLVDDAGQIHVKWENGSGLALNLECDEFEVIEEGQK